MQAIDWFLVANAANARVYARTPGEPLRLVHSFEHPRSRRRTSQLGDDRAGREKSASGFGGAAFQPRTDAHRKEHARFAQEVCAYIEHEARVHAFGSLSIFAPEPFAGELRSALGSTCRKHLRHAGGPDLSHVGPAELEARIDAEVPRERA